MATPQESITTVNGKRCSRSRARTAATTSTTTEESAVVTPTEVTSSTTLDEASQIQTSTAAAPPPPPPPPPSSSTTAAEQPTEQPTEQPVAAPPTSTTEAAATSAIGTISPVPTSSTRIAPLPKLAPAGPAAAAPGQPSPESEGPSAVPSQAAAVSSTLPTSLAPTNSEVVALAVPTSSAAAPTGVPASSEIVPIAIPTSSDTSPIAVPPSSLATSSVPARFTAPAASDPLNSPDTSPDQPIQTDTDPSRSVTDTTAVEQPQPTSSILKAVPSGGSAGIIGPDPGSEGTSSDSPLTLGNGSNANIGGIIGGVFGGLATLALISGLLFFCLRKRKSRPARWNEKKAVGPRFVEKMKSIPAGAGVFVAKMKERKTGATRNHYQQHTVQSSVGSVYSTDTSGRVRSASEPQGMLGVKRAGSNRSISSKKSERNLLRKKGGSVSSNYRFPGIMEDKTSPGKGNVDPFADPEPPKSLMLLNPDPRSAPVTPQVPAATAGREIQDPFASILDPPRNVPAFAGVPTRNHQHQRTMSSMSALSSHPPSSYPTNDPFRDPFNAPGAPTKAVPPTHNRRSSMALPTFDTTSSGASRDSNYTFFGEPGPSRPGTNLFTPGLPTGRTVRQSDPFDLDRPEVLGFGDVIGRKEVGGSVTRQASRNRRVSSVGNWFSTAGQYTANSAKPGPLFGPNAKR